MHELLLAFIVLLLIGWEVRVLGIAERNGTLRIPKKSPLGSSWSTHSFGLC